MDALFPFHPRMVHFPIALTLVGVFFVLLSAVRARVQNAGDVRASFWLQYGRTTLLLGWLGVLAAIATGLVDQSRAPEDAVVASTINLHITVGIALLVLLGYAVYWPLQNRNVWTQRRWLYLALLAGIAALVLLESWLGDKLVYQLGVSVGP
jgi:uncharacterized membrane protein